MFLLIRSSWFSSVSEGEKKILGSKEITSQLKSIQSASGFREIVMLVNEERCSHRLIGIMEFARKTFAITVAKEMLSPSQFGSQNQLVNYKRDRKHSEAHSNRAAVCALSIRK